jgi:hypothetical protein
MFEPGDLVDWCYMWDRLIRGQPGELDDVAQWFNRHYDEMRDTKFTKNTIRIIDDCVTIFATTQYTSEYSKAKWLLAKFTRD